MSWTRRREEIIGIKIKDIALKIVYTVLSHDATDANEIRIRIRVVIAYISFERSHLCNFLMVYLISLTASQEIFLIVSLGNHYLMTINGEIRTIAVIRKIAFKDN